MQFCGMLHKLLVVLSSVQFSLYVSLHWVFRTTLKPIFNSPLLHEIISHRTLTFSTTDREKSVFRDKQNGPLLDLETIFVSRQTLPVQT
jgi:hypothetical protein